MKIRLKIVFGLLALVLVCWLASPFIQAIIHMSKVGSASPRSDTSIQIYSWTFPNFYILGTAFALTIVNNQETPVMKCRLIFDSKYAANLDQLERLNPETHYDFPPIKDIPPESSLTFEFSHDVGNWWHFRDQSGDKYPSNHPPDTIRMESSNFPPTTWKLSWHFNQGRRVYLPLTRQDRLEGEEGLKPSSLHPASQSWLSCHPLAER